MSQEETILFYFFYRKWATLNYENENVTKFEIQKNCLINNLLFESLEMESVLFPNEIEMIIDGMHPQKMKNLGSFQ